MNKLMNDRIIAVTKNLFQTTFGTAVVAGKPYISEPDVVDEWDVSGVISVTGVYSGLIAIRFKKALPAAMLKVSRLKNLQTEHHDKLVNDMVGELTNVISGNTFSNIKAGEIMLSIPVTILGENHIISWSQDPLITVIPFYIDEQRFVVETEIKKIS